MMSMLIPSPKSLGMNIDVYLRPLINELIELWKNGVEPWDAKVKNNFKLHDILLWTINDFPAYDFWLEHKRQICMSILPQGYQLFVVEILGLSIATCDIAVFCPQTIKGT